MKIVATSANPNSEINKFAQALLGRDVPVSRAYNGRPQWAVGFGEETLEFLPVMSTLAKEFGITPDEIKALTSQLYTQKGVERNQVSVSVAVGGFYVIFDSAKSRFLARDAKEAMQVLRGFRFVSRVEVHKELGTLDDIKVIVNKQGELEMHGKNGLFATRAALPTDCVHSEVSVWARNTAFAVH